MTRNRLYLILGISCLAGYAWLFIHSHAQKSDGGFEVCPIKTVTGIPCPSCGSTRSVEALISGDVLASINYNPLGIVVALIMLLAPIWLVWDLYRKEETLFVLYKKTETTLRKKPVAITLIFLITCNWIWNIWKEI